MITRRQFAVAAASPLLLAACSARTGPNSYAALAGRTWRDGPGIVEKTSGLEGAALRRELVRYATLAPSSHNTQCWKFLLDSHSDTITILPDWSRRCPAVDPDDHHLFVSLGCATESLVQAALAHGFSTQVSFDAVRGAVVVALAPAKAQRTALFNAIVARQCTRGDYDGKPVAGADLALLERAASADGVRMLVIAEPAGMERVLEQVVQANSRQMADPAFMRELKTWIRFNDAQAVRSGDGLFTATSGNPTSPTWLGARAFDWFLRASSENDKYARQIRSSAGIAVFVGAVADRAHWVEVGRCYERFALQATALGIRNAMINQPVEVAALRPQFASILKLGGQRPDLVVRFGRGAAMPPSLRRPVDAVLV